MNLTVDQLRQACANNRFIAARYSDNTVIGINCGIAKIKSTINKPNLETDFTSYYPIDFQEYISIKAPYFTSNKS